MDPKSLLENLKRTFAGFGGQAPSSAPFAIPKPPAQPSLFSPLKQTSPAINQTPVPPPVNSTAFIGPKPFIGPVRPAVPTPQPPVASTVPPAPPAPKVTSTGQTINTATGGIVSGATTPTPPVSPAPIPETPIIPTVPTAEQEAVTTAEQAYKTAGMRTPEEEAAQAELDKLTESFKKGYLDVGEQAIPMGFITGQEQALEKRALGLAEPLTAKLARLEAKRLSGLATSKFALERADKAAETARGAETAKKTAEESARRFEIEQKGAEATRALAEKKFAQDTKEFGLDYAIKQRDVATKEKEVSSKLDEATKTADDKSIQLLGSVQIVNDILKNPGVISGVAQTGSIPFTAGATIKNKYEQLRATLALGARGLLKGGGAISDYESKVLNQSTSALGRNQTEEQFTKTLKEIRGILSSNAGLPTSVQVIKDGVVVDSGDLNREDIYDAIKQGYQISYQ